jgi:type IV pilus assembly protein PilC
MATAQNKAANTVKDSIYTWEGKDKAGKQVRGELRAGGENIVSATLRRQGILVTKVKKKTFSTGKAITEKDIALFTRQPAYRCCNRSILSAKATPIRPFPN